MSTATKAFLLLHTTVLFLLTIHWLSPFIYKYDGDGGHRIAYVLYVKQYSPSVSSNRDKLSDIYRNGFNAHKKYSPPVIDEKDVVVLSEKNFSHFVAKNRHVLVHFYVPWCSWCTKLAPEYALAATELKGEVVLAKVDATMDTGLARKYRVQGYPTMYFFAGGVKMEDYDYSRTKDAIAEWMRSKAALGINSIMTTEQAEQVLMAESTIVLGFFHSLEGRENEELVAASKLHTDVIFYQTTSADVAKTLQIDPEIKRPALILLEKEAKHLSHFNGSFTKSAIADFIFVKNLPPVITFTNESAPFILKSYMKQIWLFALAHDSKATSIFQEAAKGFKTKLLFVHVQMDLKGAGRQIAYDFGITGPAPRGPRVIAYTGHVNATKHLLNDELTLSNLKSFAENFLEDKISSQPYLQAISWKTNFQLPSQPEKVSETEFISAIGTVTNTHSYESDPASFSHMNYVQNGWI